MSEKKQRVIAEGFMVCPWGGGYEQAAFENFLGSKTMLEFKLHKWMEGAAQELDSIPHGIAKYMAIRKIKLVEEQ